MTGQLKVLFLSSNEYGDRMSGGGVIVTNTLNCLASTPGTNTAIGLFRVSDLSRDAVLLDTLAQPLLPVKNIFNIPGAPLNKLAILRGLTKISSSEETLFLRAVSKASIDYDVAIWFGSGYDPVSLKLPSYCKCPLLFHIADSLLLHQEKQITKRHKKIRNWIAKQYETLILASRYARVVYVSKEDYEVGVKLLNSENLKKVICLPIGVDITAFCPREHSKLNPDKVVLLFAGVMHYQPNVDAALFLIREIMPRLKHNIELRIVGRGPTAEIIESAKNDSRIVVTGTVPDIIGEHQNSDIFVAPMISGAGIKIKILQAMACGLPVITTSVCVRAFPETPAGLLTGDSVDQLVFMINRLIANVTEREQLGREGRMFVEKKWSWEQRTKKLVKIYTEVADCKRVSRA